MGVLRENSGVYLAGSVPDFEGARVFTVDAGRVNSEQTLMLALAEAMSFPKYFGWNWEAVLDCLRDLS